MPRVVALFQRLLPIKQVSDRVGLSRSTIYDMMARNEFPRPVDTSSTHTVRWVESEVNNWITERIKERARHQRQRIVCAVQPRLPLSELPLLVGHGAHR